MTATATATATAVPQNPAVTFEGQIFDIRSHILISQVLDGSPKPRMRIEIEVVPGSEGAPNTAGTRTTVWPPIGRIEVWAELISEIHCAEVAGIAGGCATLPRLGHRERIHTLYNSMMKRQLASQGWDPCTAPAFSNPDPAAIEIDADVADELLAVAPDGRGGGPGTWEISIEVNTLEVPAGSCHPPLAGAHPAGGYTVVAPDTARVALRIADIVAE